MADEVLDFSHYRELATTAWEKKRAEEIDVEARRLRQVDRARSQAREDVARRQGVAKAEFEVEARRGREAAEALYGAELAELISPTVEYELIRVAGTSVAGIFACSPALAAEVRVACAARGLYCERTSAGSVRGTRLGGKVGAELLALDPTTEEVAEFARQEADAKKERQGHEAEVRQREREDAEAERRRRKYGAPVS